MAPVCYAPQPAAASTWHHDFVCTSFAPAPNWQSRGLAVGKSQPMYTIGSVRLSRIGTRTGSTCPHIATYTLTSLRLDSLGLAVACAAGHAGGRLSCGVASYCSTSLLPETHQS